MSTQKPPAEPAPVPPTPEAALYAALARLQGRMTDIVATHVGTAPGKRQYKYPALDDILPIARPVIAEEGLAIVPRYIDGGIHWLVAHRDGGTIEWFGPYAAHPGDPRSRGACQTYDRRYQYCAILGIAATEDDDAQSVPATEATRTEEAPPATTADDRAAAKQAFWRAWAKAKLPSWKTDADAAKKAADDLILRVLGVRKYLKDLSASETMRLVDALTTPAARETPADEPPEDPDPFRDLL